MRIGLLKYRPFHEAILRPVFDALRASHKCLLTGNEAELVSFRPNVVIMSESVISRLRHRLPRALFVHTRHGLASKNVTYRGASETDYMCVTSPFVRDWYLQNGARPLREFWVIGYLQMDGLFRGLSQAPSGKQATSGAEGRKTILYAPTWNEPLSSAPMLGEHGLEVIRSAAPDASLVIKPHPLIATHSPQWLEWWRRMAERDRQVELVEDMDCDVIPYLQQADLLVTDASSVQLEFLATDRPMILINNPDRFSSKDYDPRGFEWTWRDMGEELSEIEALPAAISRALADPRERAPQRARYRKLLFGDLTDGRTLERLCQRVEALRSVVPRVTAVWVASWPLRKARGLTRRMVRLAGRKASSNGSGTPAPADGATTPAREASTHPSGSAPVPQPVGSSSLRSL